MLYIFIAIFVTWLLMYVSVHLVDTRQTEQEKTAETEALQAMQALKDRQQMAFDKMFNALLVLATTKDICYLLAAQRSLTAVHNQEGDT